MLKLLLFVSAIGIFNFSCAKPQRYINRGLFGRAEKYCYSLAGQNQKDCFFKVGKALFEKQKFIHASDLFEKAGSSEMENKCYLALAEKAVNTGNFDYAGKWYLKANHQKQARQYFEKEARKLLKKGELKKAARFFGKADNQEEFKKTVLKVGKKMENKNNLHSALQYYKTVGIEMKPIYQRFASHYLKYGRIHESMKCFDLAGVKPEQYYKIIGEYFLQKRDFNKALSYFLKAGIPRKKSFELIAQSALQMKLRSKAEIYYYYSGLSKSEIQLKLAKYYRAQNRFYLAGDYFLKSGQRNQAVSMFQKVLKLGENLQNSSYALIKLVKLKDKQTITNLEKYTGSNNKHLAGAAELYSKITKNKKLNTTILVYHPFGKKMNSKKWKNIIKLPRISPNTIVKKIPVLARGYKKQIRIRFGKKRVFMCKYFYKDSKWLKKIKDTGKYDLIIETFMNIDLVSPKILTKKVIKAKQGANKREKQKTSRKSKYYGTETKASYLQLIKVHIPSLFIEKSFQTLMNYQEYPLLKKKDLYKLRNKIIAKWTARWKNKNKKLKNQILNLFKEVFVITTDSEGV
ncbi:MAG: hypothetical protein ACQES9_00720 [Myxococcota bacterium]